MADRTQTDRSETTVAGDGPPAPPSDEMLEADAEAGGEVDPHGLRLLVDEMSPAAAKAGEVALAVLSVLLRDGEQVNDLAVGELAGANAVLALTDDRLVLASDRRYRADAFEFPLADGLEVRGWQDADKATVTVSDATDSITLAHVIDRPSAHRLAAGVEWALGD